MWIYWNEQVVITVDNYTCVHAVGARSDDQDFAGEMCREQYIYPRGHRQGSHYDD